MWLNEVWFILFVVIIAGYLILDGFDLGVGMLHPFVARSDEERRISLNSIGPIWDGNEVWLVLGGGALFAAFPPVYAALFSGLYVAMMLVLIVLILRTVAIEFRSKRPGSNWRSFWDVVFAVSSLGIALLLGVAFGNIVLGLPLDQDHNIFVSLVSLLSPFALLVGATTVVMFALHGAIYLTMKTEGDLYLRVRRWLLPLMVVFFVVNTVLVFVAFRLQPAIAERYRENVWLVIFPLLALIAFAAAVYFLRARRDLAAFVCSGAMIGLLLFAAAAGVYPNLLISTIDPAYNLTIFNAASEANTLTVMLIFALIGMPFVLLYTSGVYYFFRGRVRLTPESY